MCNSNLYIEKRIKEEFMISGGKGNIRIPGGITFCAADDTVKMKLSSKAVSSNMQADNGAFEGWALVLKRWCNYGNVVISWDKPEATNNGHYQRFLFRLKQFSQDFGTWVSVGKECEVLLEDLRIKNNGKYLLNIPGERNNEVSSKSEAQLEDRFINGDLRQPLMSITNAVSIFRQLPVGVFENSVSRSTRIFTGGKSAVDIWGLSKTDELLVFELKAANNKKVGIISELYFYVSVLNMVRKRIFLHGNCSDDNILKIPDTRKIKAFFLLQSIHPLIDKKVLELLTATNPDDVSYHYLQIGKDGKLMLDNFN